MVINHNIAALNTYRQLSANNAASSKSLEKLSSGFRINRAGDDAAGLGISEKMRSQIRGLDQATRNAQDGISLIQTAEGALSTTHSILQRMRELADQSANGTLNQDDRNALQQEVTQLKNEIDRIGNSTEFNTKKLINGALKGTGGDESVSLSSAAIFRGSKGSITGVDATGTTASAIDLSKTDAIVIDGKKIEIAWSKYVTLEQKNSISKTWATTAMTATESHTVRDIMQNAINSAIDDSGTGVKHVVVTDSTTGMFKIESQSKGSSSKVEFYYGNDGAATAKLADGTTIAAASDSVLDIFLGKGAEMGGGTVAPEYGDWLVTVSAAGSSFTAIYDGQRFNVSGVSAPAGSSLNTLASSFATQINTKISSFNVSNGLESGDEGFLENIIVKATSDGRLAFEAASGDFSLKENANKSILDDQGLSSASIEDSGQGAISFQIGANKGQTMALSIGDMRASALGVSGLDVSTVASASTAISTLDTAISNVSVERGKLGALQNRLEYTINNLSASNENLTAAESRVRDVDMAKEMMEFTKNNILTQAAQAMLAQANQQPQGVLQLLR